VVLFFGWDFRRARTWHAPSGRVRSMVRFRGGAVVVVMAVVAGLMVTQETNIDRGKQREHQRLNQADAAIP
jgi:hypothetical protein